MKQALGAIMVTLALLVTGCASSEPAEVVSAPAPAPASVLDRADGDPYTGVAALSVASRCTGTVIDTGVDSAPAYILTNGHCLGMDGRGPNDVLIDEKGSGDATFFAFHDVAEADRVTVPVVRFEYATMHTVDLGIARLDASLGDLRAQGITPLTIAPAGATSGAKVENIAVPVDGIEKDDWVLRKGSCTLSKQTDVVEFHWLWRDAIINNCPGVVGGSSGSPLIADGKVVSVLNTTNRGVTPQRGVACYLGQPCQVQGDTVKFVVDTAYGVDLRGVDTCFPNGVFAVGGDCSLPTAIAAGVSGGGTFSADGTDTGGRTATIDLTSPAKASVTYRIRSGLASADSCADAAFFADAQEVTVAAGKTRSIDVDLPETEGFQFACVTADGVDAAVLIFNVDTTPPTDGPKLSANRLGDGSANIDPLCDNPEIVDIRWLTGPADSIDCADRDKYLPYFRQALMVSPEEMPFRLCVVGFDLAGNESPLTDQTITAGG